MNAKKAHKAKMKAIYNQGMIRKKKKRRAGQAVKDWIEGLGERGIKLQVIILKDKLEFVVSAKEFLDHSMHDKGLVVQDANFREIITRKNQESLAARERYEREELRRFQENALDEARQVPIL